MMGVELVINFNSPYVATNPSDFWRRWHISLSTWLRDYLYIPLGGNRGGPGFVYRNLMVTMVLGGLWHGARTNFVLWGIYQGALLVIHRAMTPWLNRLQPRHEFWARAWAVACWLVFLQLVCYGWLLFRADNVATIQTMTVNLLHGWSRFGEAVPTLSRLAFYMTPLVLFEYVQVRSNNQLAPLSWSWPVRAAAYVGLFFLTIVFGAFHVTEFIYFQF